MPTLPDAPPVLPLLPDAPNSATDTPAQFDVKANNLVDAQVSQVPQNNALATWENTTATQVYNNAVEASTSATNAASSEDAAALSATFAAQSANFLGEWSTATGAATKGAIVINNDFRWQLKVDLADITLSEPSTGNADWLLIGANNRVIVLAAAETLTALAVNEIQATQSNPLPPANSVSAGTILTVTVTDSNQGIVTTHLVSGSDTTTDSSGNSDGFVINWSDGGSVNFISNGLNNWRY
tara:strand:- start:1349 stop:2071 length:723 start_codon:yes stop_codon:yes gene_type:complete